MVGLPPEDSSWMKQAVVVSFLRYFMTIYTYTPIHVYTYTYTCIYYIHVYIIYMYILSTCIQGV